MSAARANAGEILLYQSEDGQSRIEVRLAGETLWLTAAQMAELFQVDKSGISRHLKNVYDTGELPREGTVALFAAVRQEDPRQVERKLEHFNLDAIISVGYRFNRASSRKSCVEGRIPPAEPTLSAEPPWLGHSWPQTNKKNASRKWLASYRSPIHCHRTSCICT